MKHTKHLLVLWAALLIGAGNAWGTTKTGSWNLTSTSTAWEASGNETYFSQPYGYKKVNGTLLNKSIADFSTAGITEIKVGFKCLQNGATTSKITIYLVDKDGNTIGDGVEVTPVNASAATNTTYQYATFTTNLTNATGFMMKVTTFGKNILVNGAEYTITYSEQTYPVQWMVDGAPWPPTQVNEGAKATPPTGTPTACSGKVFVGWSSKNIGATPTDDPGKLFTDESPNAINGADSVFYAVFATATTMGSGAATYELVTTTPTDWSGTYIISTGTYVVTGQSGTNSYCAYTNHPTSINTAYEVEIAPIAGTDYYSIYHTSGGKYLGGQNSTTMAFDETAPTGNAPTSGVSYHWSLSTSGLSTSTSGSRKLCTNTSASRFSMYTPSSSYVAGQLYKKVGGSTTTYSDYITQCDDSKASVSYNFNGGDGTCTTATVNKGDNYAICTEVPSRTGYTFGGWSDGTTIYAVGATITNVQANITLTAQWQANTYTVTFDPNGGNVTPTTVDYTYDGAVVAMPIPTHDGFGFVGWYTEQTGGTKWKDVGNTNKPTSNITLYAHWSELYDVLFIANGQTFVTQTDKYCSGDALQLPATDPDAGTYACAGYTFVGWASDEQSTETTTCPTLVSASTPITADATFHAVWKKSDGGPEQEVTFDASDISNLTELTSLSWKENTSNVTLTLSAGQRYTSGTPNTFTVTKGVTNYFEVTGNAAIKKVVVEISATNYTINTVNTDDNVTISTADLIQTLIVTTSKNSVKGYASADNQIRMKKITVTCGTAYYTTSPKCCPVNLQNPVVSTLVADGSVTLNWTMPADADKVTNYTVTCVGGVTADITETSYTFTGLTNCTEYTFTVRANGDGTAVCPSEVATVKATPAADSFTVTFDYGAGAGTPASWASGCGNGTSVTLPEPTTLPDNHTFEGWYDGTTLYASGDTYTPTADITLTARYTKKAGVDVVEWDPNSVTVEIGVGGAAQVQIENEVTSGSGTGKVADELFFSKYFEGSGSLKLLGIFNGTNTDIDLTNYTLLRGSNGDGTSGTEFYLSQLGTIKQGQEIILFAEPVFSESPYECSQTFLADKKTKYGENENPRWILCDEVAHNGITFPKLNFSGDDPLILRKNGVNIDVWGVSGKTTVSKQTICTGRSDECWVADNVPNMDYGKTVEDFGGTIPDGVNIDDEYITAYTARVIMFRSNSVQSGANAVANNTSTFATFSTEWQVRQVCRGKDDGDLTCAAYTELGLFDYNGYYSTYQELTKVDLGGNQNADGTYTIPVSGLNDISCSKIRINVLDGSSSSPLVSSEYKVPIMVNASDVTTTNAIFTKHKVADCSKCDVVVLKGATLEKAPDGTADDRNEFRNMEVYAGGKLKVPASATDLKVNKLVMRSKGDEVPVAEINGTLTIADKLYHAKRIDAARFYFFTLPYDCNVADITYYNGEVLSGNGDGYLIKYYDGAGRAIGQNAGHWEVYTGSLLEAGKGYIVAISASLNGSFESNPKKELLFPMTNALSETTTKTVSVGTYGIGDASIGDNHKGWNLIGCPFMSNYYPIDESGLMVGTYEDGTWDEGGKIFTYNPSVTVPYVTMPNTDGKTYTQKLASSQDLQPFRSFFVQVGKVGDIISDVAFSSANRKAPRKAPAADAAVWVELTLSNASGSDATTVIVDDDKTTDYEIGADLEKMLGYAALPQFYSLKSSTRLAFNALPSASASGAVPLGFYAPASDTYTIAMNTTQAQNLEGVYLTDNVTGTVTNLLLGDYSFTSGRTLNDARFSLAVVRSVTAVDNVLLEAVTPVVHRRTLRIDNAPVGSLVRVYDTLGREVVSEQIDAETVVYQLQMPGVYHVQIITKDSKSVYKVVSY